MGPDSELQSVTPGNRERSTHGEMHVGQRGRFAARCPDLDAARDELLPSSGAGGELCVFETSPEDQVSPEQQVYKQRGTAAPQQERAAILAFPAAACKQALTV